MNITPNEIYTIKLITGEEIVTRVISQDPQGLTLENPILCVLSPQGLQMMPALFSANMDKNVRLNTGSWALIAEVREDVRNSWIQATTGIAPASKKILTG
jgi:hypothetical protein